MKTLKKWVHENLHTLPPDAARVHLDDPDWPCAIVGANGEMLKSYRLPVDVEPGEVNIAHLAKDPWIKYDNNIHRDYDGRCYVLTRYDNELSIDLNCAIGPVKFIPLNTDHFNWYLLK